MKKDLSNLAATEAAHQGRLMAQRTTDRYAKKGTIHSNQAYFVVDRDTNNGRFVARDQ